MFHDSQFVHPECLEYYENHESKANELNDLATFAKSFSETHVLEEEEASLREKFLRMETGHLIQIPQDSLGLKRNTDMDSFRERQISYGEEIKCTFADEKSRLRSAQEEFSPTMV